MVKKESIQYPILKTKRLTIIPLDEYNLRLLIEDWQKMESSLGVEMTGFKLEKEIAIAMKECLQAVIDDSKNYLWCTNWVIILKEENRIIGGACFKGKPDEWGNVEIGYGINEEYRNKGYATEAVNQLIRWALIENNVQAIIAETDKDNIPSWRVLEKNGMKKFKETEKSIWWKLVKKGVKHDI